MIIGHCIKLWFGIGQLDDSLGCQQLDVCIGRRGGIFAATCVTLRLTYSAKCILSETLLYYNTERRLQEDILQMLTASVAHTADY